MYERERVSEIWGRKTEREKRTKKNRSSDLLYVRGYNCCFLNHRGQKSI